METENDLYINLLVNTKKMAVKKDTNTKRNREGSIPLLLQSLFQILEKEITSNQYVLENLEDYIKFATSTNRNIIRSFRKINEGKCD